MSVEGMWAVYFGDVVGGGTNSGIAILETGRVFGGDSFIAYLGRFEVSGNRVTAKIMTWAYNNSTVVQTAFGRVGPAPTEVTLEGEFNRDNGKMGTILGWLWESANPGTKLTAKLVKIENLPNPQVASIDLT